MRDNKETEEKQARHKDWEHVSTCGQILSEAVANADTASIISVLQKDLVYWALSLKRHMFKLFEDYGNNLHHFYRKGFAPYWLSRNFVGMHEAFEMLEFHKGVEYANSFAKRFDKLLQLRNEFIDFAVSYQGSLEEPQFYEFQAGVDYKRKDLKQLALSLADHLHLVYSNLVRTADKATKNTKVQTNKKLGCPKKYTERFLQKVKTSFERNYQETGHKQQSWQLAAEEHGLKSGKAAEIACHRYLKKQNKKQN